MKAATVAKASEIIKNFFKDPLRIPWSIKVGSSQRGCEILLCVGFRTNLMVDAVKTKVNQVLDSPITVSTGRVELITSMVTISDEIMMLAKSRS